MFNGKNSVTDSKPNSLFGGIFMYNPSLKYFENVNYTQSNNKGLTTSNFKYIDLKIRMCYISLKSVK